MRRMMAKRIFIIFMKQYLQIIFESHRFYNMKNKQKFLEDESDFQNQGFQQQKIQINHQQTNEYCNHFKLEIGNDLIQQSRPKDFLPRIIHPYLFYNNMVQLNKFDTFQSETLITQKRQKIKMKKFKSLYQKYEKSKLYKMIYCKTKNKKQEDYENSYLNLNSIMDYNPNIFNLLQESYLNQQTRFDSNFQSGNLLYAYQVYIKNKIHQNQFDLILQNDINTKGYNQWFYFSFRNLKLSNAKFNIVNLIKKKNLFIEGVRPVSFSIKLKKWISDGKNIQYYKSMILRENGQYYYTLSFEIDFKQLYDKTYFALTLPYTYTKMINFIDDIYYQKPSNVIYQKKILCYSISNNPIPYIILKTVKSEKKIILMARQHPGQTVSSFVLEGFVKQLLKTPLILQKFQIIIIPMVNPDGVIYGNFRSNLSGFDLNRQWANPNRWLQPEIYFLKKLIFSMKGEIQMVIDFHGHSKKFNSFIYAVKLDDKIQEKIFPYLMSRNQLFDLKQCTYGIAADKLTTARATINQLNINNTYTLQTSFYGFIKNSMKQRFTQNDFNYLGKSLLESMQIYFFDPIQMKNIENQIKQKMFEFQMWQIMKKNDSGSQSNPSADQLSFAQRKQKVISINVRKKKQKNSNQQKQQKKGNSAFFLQRSLHKQKLRNTFQQKINKINKRNKEALFSIQSTNQNQSSIQILKSQTKQVYLKQAYIAKMNPNCNSILYQTNQQLKMPEYKINSSQQRFNFIKINDKAAESWRKLIQSAKGTFRQQAKTQHSKNKFQEKISLEIRSKILTKDKINPIKQSEYLMSQKKNKSKFIKEYKQQKSLIINKIKTTDNEQKSNQNNQFLSINHSKRLNRLYEPKKIKQLKDVEKNKKQLIFLGQLMRPKINQSQHIIYLNVEQDLKKQFKNKSELNKYKRKPIFIDYKNL